MSRASYWRIVPPVLPHNLSPKKFVDATVLKWIEAVVDDNTAAIAYIPLVDLTKLYDRQDRGDDIGTGRSNACPNSICFFGTRSARTAPADTALIPSKSCRQDDPLTQLPHNDPQTSDVQTMEIEDANGSD